MCKKFVEILVCFLLLLVNTWAFCQQTISTIESIEINNFSNNFILNGKTGKIFLVGTCDNLQNVVVRWDNGYFALGTTSKGQAVGKWVLFDKKNRRRENIIFGFECVVYRNKFNRQGKQISEFKALSPCF